MKRIGNIYKDLLDVSKIKSIIIAASKGKKKRREVQRVLENLDEYAEKILDMLKNKTYYLSPTHNRTDIRKRQRKNVDNISVLPQSNIRLYRCRNIKACYTAWNV